MLILWKGRYKVRDGVVSKQGFQVTLSCPARKASHDFSGPRAACGIPGNAGRYHYSGPLFIILGHVEESGGSQSHWGLQIIEIRGDTNTSFNLQHDAPFLEMLYTHCPQTAKCLGMNFFHFFSFIPLWTGKYLGGEKRRWQESGFPTIWPSAPLVD